MVKMMNMSPRSYKFTLSFASHLFYKHLTIGGSPAPPPQTSDFSSEKLVIECDKFLKFSLTWILGDSMIL